MATTLTDRCTQRLRQEILSGKLKAKDEGMITENYLCKHLKVSRVTIRRCLSSLREENLLRSVPYKGYVLGPAAYQGQRNGKGKVGAESSEQKTLMLLVRPPEAGSINGNPHTQKIWEGALSEAESRGFSLEECRMDLKLLIKSLKSKFKPRLAGVALDWYDREVVEALLKEGIPAVSVESFHEGMPMDGVVQDDASAIQQAIDRFWTLGHRRIGLVVWSQHHYQPPRRRSLFAAEMIKRGVVKPQIGISSRFDARGGREACRLLMSQKVPPTAILMGHLEMAAGVFDELEARNLNVGKDVSVIGWGTASLQKSILHDTPWADISLDLLEWSREELGRNLVRTLEARRLNPMLPPLCIQIPVKLSTRGSCARA